MGIADKPMIADKYNVNAEIGGNSSLIILFHNPFHHDIIVDVELNEKIINDEEGKLTIAIINSAVEIKCGYHSKQNKNKF